MTQSAILKGLLNSNATLVVPDAYDPISARIIERAGFKAVQCSGASFAIAACRPHELDIGFEENVARTAGIIDAVAIPVMADGEDGFGGVAQIPLTIARYLKIGTAGINLEDQVLDRQPGTRLIDCGLMQEKIRAARRTAQSAGNPDFIINGRTDALTAGGTREAGLQEAIRRGNLYFEAGADLVFVTRVKTREEVATLVRELHGPLSIAAGLPYNLHDLSLQKLRDLGVRRVSLPLLLISSTIQALEQVLATLPTGDLAQVVRDGRLCDHAAIQRLTAVNPAIASPISK